LVRDGESKKGDGNLHPPAVTRHGQPVVLMKVLRKKATSGAGATILEAFGGHASCGVTNTWKEAFCWSVWFPGTRLPSLAVNGGMRKAHGSTDHPATGSRRHVDRRRLWQAQFRIGRIATADAQIPRIWSTTREVLFSLCSSAIKTRACYRSRTTNTSVDYRPAGGVADRIPRAVIGEWNTDWRSAPKTLRSSGNFAQPR